MNLEELTAKEHYPDGTHFSEEGNKEVARRLLSEIQKKGFLNE